MSGLCRPTVIGIIRISGPQAASILNQVFRPAGHKKEIPDSNSFLFNINIKRKYCVSNNRGLMSDYICDFGGESFHELYVYSSFFSSSSFCDNGKGYNFKNFELCGGKSAFKVKELEVYKVDEI